MSDSINTVTIVAEVEDNTAAGLARVESNVGASAEQIGEALDAKVGGSAISGGAKVDKFSRSVGNATDANNLASKSVNRLVRMFNPFNIAMGAAIAGVTALGKHLYDLAVGPINESVEKFQALNNELNDFANEVEDRIVSDLRKMSGVSDAEWQRIDLLKKIKEGEESVAEIRRRANEEAQKLKTTEGMRNFFEQQLLAKFGYEKQAEAVDTLREKLEKLDELEKMRLGQSMSATNVTAKDIKKQYGRTARGKDEEVTGLDPFGLSGAIPSPGEMVDRLSGWIPAVEGEVNGFFGRMIQGWEAFAEAQAGTIDRANQQIEQMQDENFARAQTISENQIRLAEETAAEQTRIEEEYARRRMEIIDGIGGAALTLAEMGGRIASSVAKTEKAKAKAEATTAVIIASINAALEVARAISSYPNFVEMAAHAAGAAAYIAAAALAAKYGGGTPQTTGAAGGGGGGGREAFGPPQTGEDMGKTTIIIEGHVFSPEGGAGFVKSAMEHADNQDNPGRTRRDMR